MIETKNLGKVFKGKQKSQTLRAFLSRTRSRENITSTRALSDITFRVSKGETIGLIGGNGAGKSTLLKILAGTMWPTSGSAIIRGNIGALIELGAGFHPDLTGKENILLSASILGMSRLDAKNKIDQILDFAELEDHADIPVRYYSSGMFLRLGFSVASFLDSDILLIDEALSVGDALFKKKCRQLIESQRSNFGKTALVVSHDLALIQSLCTRSVVLHGGQIVYEGPSEKAIQLYFNEAGTIRRDASHTVSATLNGMGGRGPHIVSSGSEIVVELSLNLGNINPDTIIKMTIRQGLTTLSTLDSMLSSNIESKVTGSETIKCIIPKWPFNDGRYTIDLEVRENNTSLHTSLNLIEIVTLGSTFFISSTNPAAHEGVFLIEHQWSIV